MSLLPHIEIGSKVRLRSGGPTMTVSSIRTPTYADAKEPDSLTCLWFDEDNHLCQGVFPRPSLVRVA